MRGISRGTLTEFGIYLDKYSNVHFPLQDGLETVSYQNMPNMPKYLLPHGFKKNEFLYGMEQIKNKGVDTKQPIYITEGYFDVLSLHDIGLQAVGLLGTELSKHHIKQIKDAGFTEIMLALDTDSAGRDATIKVGFQLREEGFEVFEAVPTGFINILNEREQLKPFKDVNDVYTQDEVSKERFTTLYTKFRVLYEVELAHILNTKTDKTSVENCVDTVREFLRYSAHAPQDVVVEQLAFIQEYLEVSDIFIAATIKDVEKEMKEQVNKMKEEQVKQEKLLSNITIEKGKLVKNGSGLFTLDLNGIKVNNIFVTQNNKHGIFVNMPTNKGTDGKYYVQIKLGDRIRDNINFALVQAFTELNLGRTFEPRQLPITLSDEYNIHNERMVRTTKMFTLRNPDFLIMNMRHVLNDKHNFIGFEQHKDADEKWRSHFFADRDTLSEIQTQIKLGEMSEQEDEQEQEEDSLDIE